MPPGNAGVDAASLAVNIVAKWENQLVAVIANSKLLGTELFRFWVQEQKQSVPKLHPGCLQGLSLAKHNLKGFALMKHLWSLFLNLFVNVLSETTVFTCGGSYWLLRNASHRSQEAVLLSHTPAKCKIDRINCCWDNWRTDIQTPTIIVWFNARLSSPMFRGFADTIHNVSSLIYPSPACKTIVYKPYNSVRSSLS